MSRVLFIQNGESDRPGLFARALDECGVELEIVHAWSGEAVPAAPNGWAGIVIGGGSISAYETEQYPFLRDEERLIHEAQREKRPVLGICLGAQLMAGALGGKVFAGERKEIGFYDVRFTSAATSDPLWKDHAATFQPVHWHGDTFTLPPKAVLLASSDLTENQLFRVGDNSYGVQFHLEIDESVLTEMVRSDDDWLSKNGVDPAEFLCAAEIAFPKVEPIARAVFTRWTEMLR